MGFLTTLNLILLFGSFFMGYFFSKTFSRYYPNNGVLVCGVILTLMLAIYLTGDLFSLQSPITLVLFGFSSALIFHTLSLIYSNATVIIWFAIFMLMLFSINAIIGTIGTALLYIITVSIFTIVNRKSIPSWIQSLIWLCLEMLVRVRYKIRYEGLGNPLSNQNGLLLLSNHLSWIDWLVIQLPIKRRIHYLMNSKIYRTPFIHLILRLQGCIPISRLASKEGFKSAKNLLHSNHIVGAFPEGSISKTGKLGNFYKGFEYIKAENGFIIPVYIEGLWGSRLSRSKRKFCVEKKGFRRIVNVRFGSAIPITSDAETVKEAVKKLQDSVG